MLRHGAFILAAIAFPLTCQADQPWISARTAATRGYIEVQIAAVQIGKVPLKSLFGKVTESKDEQLMILLVVKNRSDSKKLNHRGFSGSAASSFDNSGPKLTDNLGNSYRGIDFGISNKVMLQAKDESIYPDKMCTDMVVFEVPVDKAESLRIELAGSNIGEEEPFRFEIPKEMINEKAQTAEETKKPKEPTKISRPPAAEKKPERKPQLRTWTSTNGKTISAEYQGATLSGLTGKVRLKKADGTVITVPLDKLSDEDQEFVKNRSR